MCWTVNPGPRDSDTRVSRRYPLTTAGRLYPSSFYLSRSDRGSDRRSDETRKEVPEKSKSPTLLKVTYLFHVLIVSIKDKRLIWELGLSGWRFDNGTLKSREAGTDGEKVGTVDGRKAKGRVGK